jgi:hypothetical protein
MNYFIYYIFLILIILFFSYVNSQHNIENFTPAIRKIYHPLMRNARISTEGFYNKHKNNITNLFRRFGLV